MAGHIFQSVIHFPDVDKIDWIRNNFINSRETVTYIDA